MISINIDSDDEGKMKLAMQAHIVPDWLYENSQIEHENKRIRLVRQHQQMLELEAKKQRDLQHKRERIRKQQQLLQKQTQADEKPIVNHFPQPKRYTKEKDDGLEF